MAAATTTSAVRQFPSVLEYDSTDALTNAVRQLHLNGDLPRVVEDDHDNVATTTSMIGTSSSDDNNNNKTNATTTAAAANNNNSTPDADDDEDWIRAEVARLENLRQYRILESRSKNQNNDKNDQQQQFDTIAASVRERFQTSWAYISLLDLGRQCFQAMSSAPDRVIATTESARRHAFCHETLRRLEMHSSKSNSKKPAPGFVWEIPDTHAQPRHRNNPWVTAVPHMRWYAGTPLLSPEGYAVGTLCVAHHTRRPWLTVADRHWLALKAVETVQVLLEHKTRMEHPATPTQADSILASMAIVAANQRVMQQKTKKRARRRQRQHDECYDVEQPSDSSSASSRRAPLKKSRSPSPPPSPDRSSKTPSSQDDDDAADASSATARSSSRMILSPSREQPSQALPDPKIPNVHPDDFLVDLLQAMHGGDAVQVQPCLDLVAQGGFFSAVTEEQMAAYSADLVTQARRNDVPALQEHYLRHGRAALDCYNRFGEGLLNLSCRRGFVESVRFLLHTVQLPVRVHDDYGRTPLHDACWNPEPQLDICTWLLERDPTLFFIADKRGYTPFQYARPHHWHIWRQFLTDHRDCFDALMLEPSLLKRFR